MQKKSLFCYSPKISFTLSREKSLLQDKGLLIFRRKFPLPSPGWILVHSKLFLGFQNKYYDLEKMAPHVRLALYYLPYHSKPGNSRPLGLYNGGAEAELDQMVAQCSCCRLPSPTRIDLI